MWFRAAIAHTIIFGLCAIANADNGQQEALPPAWNFTNRWAATEKLNWTSPAGLTEGRIFVRWVNSDYGDFTVGNVVYLKFPLNKMKFDPEKTAEFLRSMYGVPKWSTRRQNGAWVFEGLWPQAHLSLRFYMAVRDGALIYAFSSIRTEFDTNVALEAELLQRHLTQSLENRLEWLDQATAWLENTIGPRRAHATSSTSTSGLSEAQLLAELAQQNQALAAKNSAGGNSLAGATKALGTATGQVKSTAAGLQAAWNRSNVLFTQGLSLAGNFQSDINKALSPGYMSRLTAEVAASGALAASAAVAGFSLATQGIAVAIEKIHEAITGEKENQYYVKLFQDANEQVKKLTPAATALDDSLTSKINLLRELKETGGLEESIFRSKKNERFLAELKKLSENQIKQLSPDLTECIQEQSKNLDIKLEMKLYDALQATKTLLEVKQAGGLSLLCRQFEADSYALQQGYANLLSAKTDMFTAIVPWQKARKEEAKKNLQDWEKRQRDGIEGRLRAAYDTEIFKWNGAVEPIYDRLDQEPSILNCIENASELKSVYSFWNFRYVPTTSPYKNRKEFIPAGRLADQEGVYSKVVKECQNRYLLDTSNPQAVKDLRDLKKAYQIYLNNYQPAYDFYLKEKSKLVCVTRPGQPLPKNEPKNGKCVPDSMGPGTAAQGLEVNSVYAMLGKFLDEESDESVLKRVKQIKDRNLEAEKLCTELNKVN